MPSGWELKKLDELADIKGGKRVPKGYSLRKERTNYPYIRVTDFSNGTVSLSDIHYIDEAIHRKIANYTISQEDLYISVAGTLGLVGKIPKELDGASLTENANKITNIKIDRDFLLYYLQSQKIQNEIDSLKTTNAQPKLALTRIREFKIAVPPKNEQEKIAKILSTWGQATEKYSVILRKKEQKYQISLNEIFGKSKVNTSWLESSLESVSLKITDGAHSSPPSVDGGRPMLSVKDMREFEFDLSQPRLIGEKHYQELVNLGCKPEVGDVLIAKDGSVLKYIFEVKQPVEAVLLSSIAIIRPNPNLINPSFLAHFFRRDNFKEYVRRELTSGSGVPRIVLRDFRRIKIHVPDLPTQRKMVGLLDAFILEISLTRKIIDLLKNQKRGLMQHLLTGKKRVKA